MLQHLPAAKYALIQVGKEDSNGNPSLYLDGNLLLRIFIHTRSSLDKCVSGVLGGKILSWKQMSYLDIFSLAEGEIPEKIQFIEEWLEEKEEKLLGWYYSQPEKGLSITQELLELAQNYFAKPYHFLFLVDPTKRRYGIYQWQEGSLNLIPGFKATSSQEKKEQLKQLLHQTDFHYSKEEIEQKTIQSFSSNVIRAYQPKDLNQLEREALEGDFEPEIKTQFLLNRLTDYREVFLSKDILVRKDLQSREEIEQIIADIVESLEEVKIKALIKLFWETRVGEDRYFADNWICEIRWLGKEAKHSVIWNSELI